MQASNTRTWPVINILLAEWPPGSVRRPHASEQVGYSGAMSKWRIWWLASHGQTPSGELVGASIGLSTSQQLKATRLLSRGKPAPDAATARYVVALARERQRRYATATSPETTIVVFGALAALWIFLAIQALRESNAGLAILAIALTVFFGYSAITMPSKRRAVEEARLSNLRFLEASGQPYLPAGEPRRVKVAKLALSCSIVVSFLLWMTFTGVLVLLLSAQHISTESILSKGMVGAIAVLGGAFISARRSRKRSAEPLAGHEL